MSERVEYVDETVAGSGTARATVRACAKELGDYVVVDALTPGVSGEGATVGGSEAQALYRALEGLGVVEATVFGVDAYSDEPGGASVVLSGSGARVTVTVNALGTGGTSSAAVARAELRGALGKAIDHLAK